MKIGRIGRTFLVCFIFLLGTQLAGLNCLDDWETASAIDTQTISNLPVSGTGETARLADDGCPCHLALAPVTGSHSLVSVTVRPHPDRIILTNTFAFAFLLFHPPLIS